MSQLKLFGNTRSGSRLAKNRAHLQSTGGSGQTGASRKKKRRNPLKVTAAVLGCLLVCEILYFTAIYSNNSFISKWRSIYIETAMDTFSHQWLATAFIPPDIIDEVMDLRQERLEEAIGKESNWSKPEEPAEPQIPEEVPNNTPSEIDTDITQIPEKDPEEEAREAFYEMFYELDVPSMEAYVEAHPEALANGWSQLKINEAGLDDSGTDIKTVQGDQVLAVDFPNQILLVRVKGEGYLGVLAIAKDPARLSMRAASTIGSRGQTAATIAETNDGVLAMNASGFYDPNGAGNGGIVTGYAMANGKAYGTGHAGYGFKRIELHEDNLFYIKDASSPVGEGTTDAAEWSPAMIIDGEVLDVNYSYNGIHPRASIGQNDKYEIMMLVIEGRMPTRSIGVQLVQSAEILERYNCMQAMNLDGGATAVMWYDGETVTKCSNTSLPDGRDLPTAFVYGKEPVE